MEEAIVLQRLEAVSLFPSQEGVDGEVIEDLGLYITFIQKDPDFGTERDELEEGAASTENGIFKFCEAGVEVKILVKFDT